MWYNNVIFSAVSAGIKKIESFFSYKWRMRLSKTKQNERLKLAKNYAINREGLCLSSKYKNEKALMRWESKNGVKWRASYREIVINGNWEGKKRVLSYVEEYTRYIFEMMTNRKFTKIRPGWLEYKNRRNLELDGYCEELKWAFEYNGPQHYKVVYFAGKNKPGSDLVAQKERDKWKRARCVEAGVTLFEIPHTEKTPWQIYQCILSIFEEHNNDAKYKKLKKVCRVDKINKMGMIKFNTKVVGDVRSRL